MNEARSLASHTGTAETAAWVLAALPDFPARMSLVARSLAARG
jgi:hypothetical protein